MARRHQQTDLFRTAKGTKKSAYAKKTDKFGGDNRTTRASRTYRPISTKTSMHLILKSENAKGAQSLLTARNKQIVNHSVRTFAERFGIKVLSAANGGNHLHIHVKVKSQNTYKAFIRAVTGAIALKVTGANKLKQLKEKFWTQTPFTRFVHSYTDYLRLEDYILVNQAEGFGLPRKGAELFMRWSQEGRKKFRSAAGLT